MAFKIEKLKENDKRYKIYYDKYSEVEIGGDDKNKFKPEAKLKKWGDECFIKVKSPTTKNITPLKEDGKIKWKDTDKEIHFYPLEKTEDLPVAFEFEIILKKKPATNKIVLNIESKGLKFYYQPPLTVGIKVGDENGRIVEVTETYAKDKKGNIVVHRPENIVGSYAVYHESKTGNYEAFPNGKNYRAGKAFHIYRPQMIDANGWKVWGELHYEKGLLTTTIPQDFLDNAIYPIRVDPTFGYDPESHGGSSATLGTNYIRAKKGIPDNSGTGVSVSIYSRRSISPYNFKGVVLESDRTISDNGISAQIVLGSLAAWYVSSFSTGPSITASNTYYAGGIVSSSQYYYYDAGGSSGDSIYDSSNNYTTPTDPTDANNSTNLYSFYATYTPAAEGTNMEINIGDVWKDVDKVEINIGDVWKDVTKIEINVGDVWKTVF